MGDDEEFEIYKVELARRLHTSVMDVDEYLRNGDGSDWQVKIAEVLRRRSVPVSPPPPPSPPPPAPPISVRPSNELSKTEWTMIANTELCARMVQNRVVLVGGNGIEAIKTATEWLRANCNSSFYIDNPRIYIEHVADVVALKLALEQGA